MYHAFGSSHPWMKLPVDRPRSPLSGLGATIDIEVPFKQIADYAAAAAFKELKANLPSILAEVKNQAPGLVAAAMPEVKKQIPALLSAAEVPLEAYVNNRFWPKVVRPIVLKELEKQTVTIGTQAKRASLMAGGIALAGIVAFVALKKKRSS